ncbi:hypothetical protein MNEG_5692 [Monoraphidium neglectum]|uniref:Uncharacterized protein n=1 Tax=Monoraphidium neglectum TaxID=145388 RepID=A0A0D2L5F3_9CHLO|nr:hypothetical protein MNEG_5692 [Monoraphidium neglectum]KIZ02264.1 hypothetical protein MNEG_5692 [Monoraphidium neglectum]|eukprot:XP_013901283.1 hypothetical protein MNEG_5692 [Monoraphidium neglectum]
MDPEKDIILIPGPHQVWRIRTRKQAAEFWGEQYKHLREGAPPREPPSGVSGGVDPDSGTLASPREDRGSCGSGGGAAAEQDAGRQQQQWRRRQEAAARLWGHLGGGASR